MTSVEILPVSLFLSALKSYLTFFLDSMTFLSPTISMNSLLSIDLLLFTSTLLNNSNNSARESLSICFPVGVGVGFGVVYTFEIGVLVCSSKTILSNSSYDIFPSVSMISTAKKVSLIVSSWSSRQRLETIAFKSVHSCGVECFNSV